MNREANTTTIPSRSEQKIEDTWDLSSLYRDDKSWAVALETLRQELPRIAALRGRLSLGKKELLAALTLQRDCGILGEGLAYYCELRMTEDQGVSEVRAMNERYLALATEVATAWSWFEPELQSLDEAALQRDLADPAFSEYRIYIDRLLRYKPHILSEKEERLLAMQLDTLGAVGEIHAVLSNVDMVFGEVATPEGPAALSQASFQVLRRNQHRSVRKEAYEKFFGEYKAHAHSLASLYSTSVKQDRYKALVRNFTSARARALFPDDVAESVYDKLITTVSENLPLLHRYYDLRKRLLKLDELWHYDLHVPLAPEPKARYSYGEAVDLICRALAVLGKDYVETLRAGLQGRWVDRYENKGKRSGAFSAGSYKGLPYILMNYKDESIDSVFTLAHEAGHSMHSWYSARSNPFMHYGYTIFEAEVASTFNEHLLFETLYEDAHDRAEKAALVSARLGDLIGTLFRQTMFAEFEQQSHAMIEAGEALTLDSLCATYRKLLDKYFGEGVKRSPDSDLECFIIPHFYHAFYVYKYATGIAASLALARRVRTDVRGRDAYLAFLKSGGSRFPIDSLRLAGVDLSNSAPIEEACKEFGRWVGEMEKLV